jgi:hypothetical protein
MIESRHRKTKYGCDLAGKAADHADRDGHYDFGKNVVAYKISLIKVELYLSDMHKNYTCAYALNQAHRVQIWA